MCHIVTAQRALGREGQSCKIVKVVLYKEPKQLKNYKKYETITLTPLNTKTC